MWKRLWHEPLGLSFVAGTLTFLSFPQFSLWPLIFLVPFFFNRAIEKAATAKQAFWAGYAASWALTLGGFYWIVYVLHVLGNLSWAMSIFFYLAFFFISALNFPVFFWAAFKLRRKKFFAGEKKWRLFVLPTLFTVVELTIPKLFPWEIGHALFQQTYFLQAADIFGSIVFTFTIYQVGSCLPWLLDVKKGKLLSIPLALLFFHFIYSAWVMNTSRDLRPLKVSLIQPNIGSLDKLNAKRGYTAKTQALLDVLYAQTESALFSKPDMIFWPEAILPFNLDNKENHFANEVRVRLKKWNVPFIIGAFAKSDYYNDRDHNAAFLMEPTSSELRESIYKKVKLLAFGEYMPFGDRFPWLYQLFPQVSKMGEGREPGVFTMANGLRIAISICYEDIFPEFIRQSAKQNVNFLVNLTNDSWFGPTSEPYLHGNQTIFRSIEHKIPMVRVTNTGTSFYVDLYGNQSQLTPVYEASVLNGAIWFPKIPSATLYAQWGRWLFFGLLGLIFLALWIRENRLPRVHKGRR